MGRTGRACSSWLHCAPCRCLTEREGGASGVVAVVPLVITAGSQVRCTAAWRSVARATCAHLRSRCHMWREAAPAAFTAGFWSHRRVCVSVFVTSEYIAAASPDRFWDFVESAMQTGDSPDAVTVAQPLLSPVSLSVLNASIAMRAFSPAVELHRQLGLSSAHVCSGAGAWALVWGRDNDGAVGVVEEASASDAAAPPHVPVACSPEQLATLLSAGAPTVSSGAAAAPQPSVYEFDHVHGDSAADWDVTVVVYGTLGSPALLGLHRAVESAMGAGQRIRYVLRHVVEESGGSGDQTPLLGYGVILDIKNMEYKALDDRPPQADDDVGADSGEETQEEEEEAVAGILFSKLHARHPSLSDGLRELKAELLAGSADQGSLKVRGGVLVVHHVCTKCAPRVDEA